MKVKPILSLLGLFSLAFAEMNGQMARVEGELLVQLKSGVDLNQFTQEYAVLESGKLIARPMNIYKFSFDESVGPEALLEAVKASPRVVDAQFNHLVERRCDEINDPDYGLQWHHNNTGQTGGTTDSDIDSDLAWGITTGGTTANGDTIVVCVIEGGNLNHSDLQSNAWRNIHEIPNNGIDDDNNGYVDDYLGWDVNTNSDGGSIFNGNHGTSVMGMIGATGGNAQSVIGANWDVKIMSVAGENIFNEASVIAAYSYPLDMRKQYNETEGEFGAFVVATNASWGIDFGDPDDVPLWNNTYDSLGVHGVLNCGATANNNVDIDAVGDIPTALPSEYMVSVTATNDADFRTFSGFGATTVDVGAPGEDVVTTSGANGITSTSGTSFASPLTAGVIALLYSAPSQQFADLVNSDAQAGADMVREALYDGVDLRPNLLEETVTGGRINAFNSLLEIFNNFPDEEICLPPLAFESTLSDDTVYTLEWVSINDNPVTVRFKPQDSEDWFEVEMLPGEESLVLDTLSICTTYDVEIGSTCEVGGEVSYTGCLTISTLGCCVIPEDFEADTDLETEVEVEWSTDFGIDSYNLYYRLLGDDEWILFGNYAGDVDEAVVTGLEPCTEYEFLITPDCEEDQENGMMTSDLTKGCGACIDNDYCPSQGNDSSEEFIESVAIGDFLFETGNNGGYALFEDFELVLGVGQTYETTLTPGFDGQEFPEFFRVWIDFNQNGSFQNSEIVLSSDDGSSEPVIGEITIPDDAPMGATRMRVSMKYVGGNIADNVSSCEFFGWGETEDYCMSIDDFTSVSETNALQLFGVFPNPSSGQLNVDFQLTREFSGQPVQFRMFDVAGKQVDSRLIFEGQSQMDFRNLEDGMYIYNVLSQDGKVLKTGKWVKGS